MWHISLQAHVSNAENAKKNVRKTQSIKPADSTLSFREGASNAENAQRSAPSEHRRKKKKDNRYHLREGKPFPFFILPFENEDF